MNCWLFLIALLLVPSAEGFAAGDEVVVVFNSKMSESKSLAEFYAKERAVPKAQVFGLDLPKAETMSRQEFQEQLQEPLGKKLEASGLWRLGTRLVTDGQGKPENQPNRVVESRIRYLVLCYGVPLKIRPDPTVAEPEEMRLRPELRRNDAAVDSELAGLPQWKHQRLLSGFRPNPAYTATNLALIHPTNGVLIVARLDGPTPAQARKLVENALQAERDGLWGRAYIDLRNVPDPNLKQGDDWIRNAGDVCRHVGFETVVDRNGSVFPTNFPMSQIAFYAGWYTESIHGAMAAPVVEFMPGAFAYHLHSLSAASLRNTNHNWVGPLLARGVTATMGTVEEPFLGGTPDIGTFAARWLFAGMTFGEAACASQAVLSWQTTVVGDPLYRAFAKPPRQMHEMLEARRDPLIEWSHLRVVNLNLAQGGTQAESVKYLEDLPETKTSAVLSEKLGELCAALGKPSAAVTFFEQALQLKPSPMQRLRLRLSLDEKLPGLQRDADAVRNLEMLLEENPGYPEKLAIYRKLVAAATKVGNQALAAKYDTLSKPPPAGKQP